jgi:hypothetical protein
MHDEDHNYNQHNTVVIRWPRSSDHPAGLPIGCEFVCSYVNSFGIEDIDQSVFFKRTGERDELWVICGTSSLTSKKLAEGMDPADLPLDDAITWGLTVSRNHHGSISSAKVGMLEVLIRSGIGYNWPRRYIDGGHVKGGAFSDLVAKLEAELDDNSREAKSGNSAIVAAAQELHLYPRPSGTGPNSWIASCPRTNHPLRIDAEADIFGCGWCRRKGGPEELRTFVADRTAAAKIRELAK